MSWEIPKHCLLFRTEVVLLNPESVRIPENFTFSSSSEWRWDDIWRRQNDAPQWRIGITKLAFQWNCCIWKEFRVNKVKFRATKSIRTSEKSIQNMFFQVNINTLLRLKYNKTFYNKVKVATFNWVQKNSRKRF